MKTLVVNSFPSLLISVLMMSSVLCGRLAVENKIGNNGRLPDTKNSTEDYNQDVAGIRRAVPQLPPNIFFNPNQQCFLQFFLNGVPPVGLRNAHLQNMRYICQQVPAHPGTFFYATMHDEGRGIAVYSAYVLHAGNVNFVAQPAPGWIQTPGIARQGSQAIYAGQPCHKGHLYAAMTASGLPQNPPPIAANQPNPMNAANSARSTYQYTNAVPQCAAFNTGQWRVFEGRIRQYAVQTCIPAGGILYLITGVSFVAIQNTNPPQPIAVPITTMPPPVPNQPPNPAAIFQPNSMWTAGTCILGNGQSQNFAVIGNNVQNPPGMLTQEITQAQLLVILNFDIQTNGLKRDRTGRSSGVNLFPGLRKPSSPIKLPVEEHPPPSGKPPKSPKSSKSSGSRPSSSRPSSSKSRNPFRIG